jgi:hypothetical protein
MTTPPKRLILRTRLRKVTKIGLPTTLNLSGQDRVFRFDLSRCTMRKKMVTNQHPKFQ